MKIDVVNPGDVDPQIELERLRAENIALRDENKRLKGENKRLEELSTYDSLTGVLNRRGGWEEMELITIGAHSLEGGEERRHEGKTGREISLLLLDIDDFKKINDTFGHEVGDAVLKKTAELLKNSFRKYDVVARWGGEEFIVAFQGDEQDVINKFFNKQAMMPQISFDMETEKGNIKVTLSGGVTDYRVGEELDKAINRADQALYKSKEGGKNRIIKYEEQKKRE